jgi:small-conductance mechanosensitive channel
LAAEALLAILGKMKTILMRIFKPSGTHARWLLFLALAAIVYSSAEGHLQVVRKYLDTERFSLEVGDYRLTLWVFLRSAIIVILLFWVAASLSDFADGRIKTMRRLRVSTRNLLMKTFQIGIYFISGLVALDVLGINLTTLAVFGGAVGIGLGFGLQKISSNFISGFILVLERSINIDDMLELQDGAGGFVRKIGARYTLVEGFDGREMLIPNEDLIINRVGNWTLNSTRCRIEIPVRVSYNSDIEKARELMLEAAREHPASLSDPAPFCLLTQFGESSADFKLFFWIADVRAGRGGPQSDVMFAIRRKFEANGIGIPYPQRDIHFHGAGPGKPPARRRKGA